MDKRTLMARWQLRFSLIGAAFGVCCAQLVPAQCSNQWLPTPPSSALNDTVSAFAKLPNEDLVAGGKFTIAGGRSVNRLARWDGSSWSPLGTGVAGSGSATVDALVVLANGDLVAGGRFNSAGGVSAGNIARWDGTAWHAVGAGVSSSNPLYPAFVSSLVVLPNGNLVAGGFFNSAGGVFANNIARWDGTAWHALGSGVSSLGFTPPFVSSLAAMPNGDVVAGGSFSFAGGVVANNIARWNGTIWSTLGTGIGGVNDIVSELTVLPNGDLVAGGRFSFAGGVAAANIARWDGTNWSTLGSGMNNMASSLATLANGDLVAGGDFTTAGGVAANRIARWNGTTWSAFGTGTNARVSALTTMSTGDLVVGGLFSTAGGSSSLYFARLTTTCPASATSYGAGCTGSGGPNVLTATSLPWIGGAFQALATGVPGSAPVLSITGFGQAALPLAGLLQQGVPGCDLLVSPDFADVLPSSGGTARFRLQLPNSPNLVGLQFFTQMLPIELDPSNAIVAVTSTNALALTIGSF